MKNMFKLRTLSTDLIHLVKQDFCFKMNTMIWENKRTCWDVRHGDFLIINGKNGGYVSHIVYIVIYTSPIACIFHFGILSRAQDMFYVKPT